MSALPCPQVMPSGQLDLHGALFQPTWARLADTVPAGQSWVRLQERVGWQPGQLVAVTTSIWKDEYHNQNEVCVAEDFRCGILVLCPDIY
jgi:hypothetical protein